MEWTFPIKRLREAPVEWRFEAAPAELELIDEQYAFDGPVRIEAVFRPIGEDVEARGRLSARASTRCARCLAPARVELEAPIREMWLARGTPDRPELEPTAEEIIAAFHDGQTLDPRPILRELLMAELPDTAYCRQDCKGLCPGCGADLNREPCRCDRPKREPEPTETPEWKRKLQSLREPPGP